MEFNNTQRLVSDISGYCGLEESGARDDGFYNQKSKFDKLNYLTEYLQNVADYDLNSLQIAAAEEFLSMDFDGQNTMFREFQNLS